MKSHHMKIRLFSHSLGRVFSGPSFFNFLDTFFSTIRKQNFLGKILLHCRNNTNGPHMQILVDAIDLIIKTSL